MLLLPWEIMIYLRSIWWREKNLHETDWNSMHKLCASDIPKQIATEESFFEMFLKVKKLQLNFVFMERVESGTFCMANFIFVISTLSSNPSRLWNVNNSTLTHSSSSCSLQAYHIVVHRQNHNRKLFSLASAWATLGVYVYERSESHINKRSNAKENPLYLFMNILTNIKGIKTFFFYSFCSSLACDVH